jgi:antitoxin component of MazEF toxin-antitoxin module
MKQIKVILTSLVIGVLIGTAVGVNIGRGKPLLSNPFAKESLVERAKQLGNETLEQSGKALEKECWLNKKPFEERYSSHE